MKKGQKRLRQSKCKGLEVAQCLEELRKKEATMCTEWGTGCFLEEGREATRNGLHFMELLDDLSLGKQGT